MKLISQMFYLLIVVLLLQGCSRPGKTVVTPPEPDPFVYKFTAEDAKLVGLIVTDAAGVQATESEPGLYQFGANVTPQTPIRFLTNNIAQSGSSFQDIDGDGVLSAADIQYNVGFEISFIGNFSTSGDRQIFANPLTALIPASGIPSEGIAGLPEEVFEIAISQGVAAAPETLIQVSEGVEVPAKQLISQSVAILTAVQESIISTQGATEEALTAAINFVVELRDANLDKGLDNTQEFGNAAKAAIELAASAETAAVIVQVATSVGQIIADMPAEKVTYYESIILTVQKTVSNKSTVETVQETVNNDNFSANNNSLEFAVDLAEEIKASGGLTTFLDSLLVVPIAVGENGQSLVEQQVTDFNMEFVEQAGAVKLNAVNAFFDQFEMEYFIETDLYGVKVDDNHAVLATLNANETNLLGAAFEGINPARLMALCWNEIEQPNPETSDVCGNNNANLEFYALATNDEICAASYDEAMIAQINSLNRRQISCN